MKYINLKATIAATAVLFGYGCANSENTMRTEETQNAVSVSETAQDTSMADSGRQKPTEMARDTTAANYVSTENTIGQERNLLALLQQTPNLSIFLDLARAAGMDITLEAATRYTLFAPTNDAFSNLPAGKLEAMKASGNKAELTRFLQAHILREKITSAELKNNMHLTTAMGDDVIVTKEGEDLLVGGAKILASDIQASNGVMHVVNKLLVPPPR